MRPIVYIDISVSCHDDVYTRAFLVGFVVRTGANEVGQDMRLRGVRSVMRLCGC